MSHPDFAIQPLLDAIAFASRAHRSQIRKDGQTPYVSHVFRVCLIVRQVFGVDDPRILAAAVLHDTIEDTTTDFDDISKQFGDEIAGWVATLSKDTRQPKDTREKQYEADLARAPWQVHVCKLADIFDNMLDSKNLPPENQRRTLGNSRRYLSALQPTLGPETRPHWETVAALLKRLEA